MIKNILFALAILASVAVSSAREAWVNSAGFVRWARPTTITLDGLQIYSPSHSEEDLQRAGYAYVPSVPEVSLADMVIDYAGGTIRAMTAEEIQARNDAQYVLKDPFIATAETAYTNLLTQVGLQGAWADMSMTYQQVGLYMMANGLTVQMLLADKLYGILLDYWQAYGGSDLRLYPWNSPYIAQPQGQ